MNKRQKKKALKKRLMAMNVGMPPLRRNHRIYYVDQMINAFELMLKNGRSRTHTSLKEESDILKHVITQEDLKSSFSIIDNSDKIIAFDSLGTLPESVREHPGIIKFSPECQHPINKPKEE